ncbi:22060_t:CDS:2 [Gigaspora margarita]|uniref:22060_t:CDS:1 n=1 Tax=Gigaspora margarita TaxID=4874 RepID=A0ABN7UCT0_GIGMA|nr:22060_t:CDS:2 [Gigaspora margarita]
MCPGTRRLEEKYAALFETLNEEEMINIQNLKNGSKVGRRKTNELNSIINITQANNEALKVIEKATEIDCVDEMIEPGFENFIEIDKETPRKSQELAEMDTINETEKNKNKDNSIKRKKKKIVFEQVLKFAILPG